MITFRDLGHCGAIGNQLFQYAALYSVGKKNNFQIKIPDTKDHFDSGTGRVQHYFLNCFKNISAEILTDIDHQSIQYNTNYEKPIFYYEDLFNIKDFTNINGYFQSYKYFNDVKSDLINELTFRDEVIKNVNIKYEFKINDYSSIHLRCGDYSYRQNHHPIMDVEYYEKSFNILKEENYLVFSDTIEYAKNLFQKFKNINFIYLENNHPFEDLYLMSNAKNNVIANSTFSWWAAYLNKNNPRIIAPSNWLGPAYHGQWNIKDLIPNDWILI